jgi:ABC-type glycerol-3-phosphate transport system substrate-binding protein
MHRYPLHEEAAKIMQEIPGYAVAIEMMSKAEIIEKMRIQMAAKSPTYDLFGVNQMDLAEVVKAGWAEPLDNYLKKYWDQYNLDDIPKSLWGQFTINGKIYAIPHSFNIQVFCYRKDIFTEKGLTVPKTFDEWLAIAEKLNDPSAGKYAVAFGLKDWDAIAYTFSYFLWSHGGDWLDKDYKPIMNSPAGIEALETMIKLLKYAPPGVISYKADEVMVDFQQGVVYTGIQWASRLARMDDPAASKVVGLLEYAVAPAKAGLVGSTRNPVDGWYVSAFSQYKEEAVKLVLETLKPTNQKRLAPYALVSRRSVLEDPEIVKKYRWIPVCLKAVLSGKENPLIPETPMIMEKAREEIHKAILGEKTAKAALDTVAEWTYNLLKDKGYYK